MDIVIVNIVTDFESIEIIGDKDPYPSLIGIHCTFENYVVIDLKKEMMTFESHGIRVTLLLYPH